MPLGIGQGLTSWQRLNAEDRNLDNAYRFPLTLVLRTPNSLADDKTNNWLTGTDVAVTVYKGCGETADTLVSYSIPARRMMPRTPCYCFARWIRVAG